jgi:hypothetical protein
MRRCRRFLRLAETPTGQSALTYAPQSNVTGVAYRRLVMLYQSERMPGEA